MCCGRPSAGRERRYTDAHWLTARRGVGSPCVTIRALRLQVCCPLVPVSDCGPMNTPEKIIGGTRAVVKEFPWAARLGYKGEF